ncbi:MAG TPA: 7-carboxy-7-deazaguanine synthase [Allosphingosinicella sp.]|nr:7-carboxy-7-deazaguanine synthase [Allosphingosinicella sp.]
MSYAVKEIFLTLQGEGMQAGRRAVFLRFAGCNLWTGREQDRATAECRFCDTDFVGMDGENGGRYGAADLARKVDMIWGDGPDKLVVITGGEPLLQLDSGLIDELHDRDFRIAVETNGTIAAPDGIDWLCVSPKGRSEVVQRRGNELKLVWPQEDVDPDRFAGWDFDHFLIQPKDCAQKAEALAAAIDLVMTHPGWRLSLQTHKLIGLP